MCDTCCVPKPSIKKLKFCQFCAQANCQQCIYKTRPYPKNNPDKIRRGAICLKCDKKFLYRDALHENQIKLELRDTQNEAKKSNISLAEINYNQLVNEISNMNQKRQSQAANFKKQI